MGIEIGDRGWGRAGGDEDDERKRESHSHTVTQSERQKEKKREKRDWRGCAGMGVSTSVELGL